MRQTVFNFATDLRHQLSTSCPSMQRALVETSAKPPPKLPRLRPRKTCRSDVQAPALARKPLTVAEQERLLRVGLPIEMWKEIIRHAASVEHEFETCGFDGRNYTFEYSARYKADWYQAVQTRLSLVLVCKSWNNLASEYLYRSILVTRDWSAGEFVRLVRRLVNSGMVKHVRRISVYSFNGSNAPRSSLLNAIAQFPHLRVLEIPPRKMFRPEVDQTHITTLCVSFEGWSDFETLTFLPHLQHLRFSLYGHLARRSKVKLSQLKTLHVESYHTMLPFYEWLDLPNLHTLIVHYFYSTPQLSLVQHFLPHIHTLGFHYFELSPPPNNPSAPYLTSVNLRGLRVSWRDFARVVPLTAIEEVHLSLEAAGLQETPYDYLDSCIARMFANIGDKKVMPKLSCVYTDLTTNTLRILKPDLKNVLRKWLTNMKKRGIKVMTYIKTSKYADHRHCSLDEVWDAEPHWEFWEPTGSPVDIRKWDLLAEATGRDNMTWRVTKDGSECQWFEGA